MEKILVLDDEEEEVLANGIDVLKQLGNDDADPTPKQIFNAIVALSVSHKKLTSDVSKFQKETSAFLNKNKVNIEKITELVEENKKLTVKVNYLEKCV